MFKKFGVFVKRYWYLFVILIIIFLLTRSPEGSHGPNYSKLPSCIANTQLLTKMPVDLSAIERIVPLGNISVPDHTLPTDHLYFVLKKEANKQTTVKTNIYAPARIVITKIQYLGKKNNGVQITQDYGLYFSACKDISLEFGHVETLAGKLAEAIQGNNWGFMGCSTNNPTKDTQISNCEKNTDIVINEGELLGTVGGSETLASFDFFANDNNSSHKESYVKPERYTKYSNLSATCGLNYFAKDVQSLLYTKVLRTENPRCGIIAQDIANTLQGAWFALKNTKESQNDWTSHLSFVHDNTEPKYGVVGIAGRISNPMSMVYLPKQSGNINREPSEVTVGGGLFCYQDEAISNMFSARNPSGSVIAQLTNNETIKVEHINGACSTNLQFSNPIIYYR